MDYIFNESLDTLKELSNIPDNALFINVLKKAKGIAIYPNLVKAGFFIGGNFGVGILLRKDEENSWKGPLFLTLKGVSGGFQFGVSKTGLVLLIMNESGFKNFLKNTNVTIGANLDIAAGPTGRSINAETDYTLNAAIYSYSISKGLFFGISLKGSVMEVNSVRIKNFFGMNLQPEQILYKETIFDPNLKDLTEYIDKIISE